jgi:hypothetical protein
MNCRACLAGGKSFRLSGLAGVDATAQALAAESGMPEGVFRPLRF